VIASSVAWIVAAKSGFMLSFGSISTLVFQLLVPASGLAAEKATNMSPELLLPLPPMRPMPSAGRVATRFSWCGSSGAYVATTTMIEPCPSRGEGGAAASAQAA